MARRARRKASQPTQFETRCVGEEPARLLQCPQLAQLQATAPAADAVFHKMLRNIIRDEALSHFGFESIEGSRSSRGKWRVPPEFWPEFRGFVGKEYSRCSGRQARWWLYSRLFPRSRTALQLGDSSPHCDDDGQFETAKRDPFSVFDDWKCMQGLREHRNESPNSVLPGCRGPGSPSSSDLTQEQAGGGVAVLTHQGLGQTSFGPMAAQAAFAWNGQAEGCETSMPAREAGVCRPLRDEDDEQHHASKRQRVSCTSMPAGGTAEDVCDRLHSLAQICAVLGPGNHCEASCTACPSQPSVAKPDQEHANSGPPEQARALAAGPPPRPDCSTSCPSPPTPLTFSPAPSPAAAPCTTPMPPPPHAESLPPLPVCISPGTLSSQPSTPPSLPSISRPDCHQGLPSMSSSPLPLFQFPFAAAGPLALALRFGQGPAFRMPYPVHRQPGGSLPWPVVFLEKAAGSNRPYAPLPMYSGGVKDGEAGVRFSRSSSLGSGASAFRPFVRARA